MATKKLGAVTSAAKKKLEEEAKKAAEEAKKKAQAAAVTQKAKQQAQKSVSTAVKKATQTAAPKATKATAEKTKAAAKKTTTGTSGKLPSPTTNTDGNGRSASVKYTSTRRTSSTLKSATDQVNRALKDAQKTQRRTNERAYQASGSKFATDRTARQKARTSSFQYSRGERKKDLERLSSPSKDRPNDVSRFYLRSGTVAPMDLLRADTISGRNPARTMPSQSQAQKAKAAARKKQAEINQQRYATIPLSAEDRKLSAQNQMTIQQARSAWAKARDAGDLPGMRRAHEIAEAVRYRHGYTGGETGDTPYKPKLSMGDRLSMNREGEIALRQAMLDADRAIGPTAKKLAAARIEEVKNSDRNKSALQKQRDREEKREEDRRRILSDPSATQLDAHGRPLALNQDADKMYAGIESVPYRVAGSALTYLEGKEAARREWERDTKRDKWQKLADKLSEYQGELESYEYAIEQYGYDPKGRNKAVLEAKLREAQWAQDQLDQILLDPRSDEFDATLARVMGLPTSPEKTHAERWLEKGNELREYALDGLGPVPRTLAETALSMAENAPALIASAATGSPIPAMVMGGIQAGGQEIYNQRQKGADAKRAMDLGNLKALSEGGWEAVGVGNLVGLATGRIGKPLASALASQFLAESGEELGTYSTDYLIDRYIAKDPDARFSVAEAAREGLIGGLAGLGYGAVGAIAGMPARGGSNVPAQTASVQTTPIAPPTPAATTESARAEQMDTARQRLERTLEQRRAAQTQSQTMEETDLPEAVQRQMNRVRERMAERATQQEAAEQVLSQATGTPARRMTEPARARRMPGSDAPSSQREILERNINTLGDSGRRAILSQYRDGEDVMAYRRGFQAVYDQALNGKDDDAISIPRSLSTLQARAAADAGRNDRAAQIEREQAAAENARVAKNGGLMDRRAVREIVGRKQADEIHQVAKAFGQRVRVVSASEMTNANAQGEVTGTEIKINRDYENGDPVTFIVGHEFTHRMQEISPEAYRAYRDVLMQDEALLTRVDDVLSAYERAGEPLTRDQAMDEIAADEAGRLFADTALMQDFIARNKANQNVLVRMWQAIKSVAAKLTGRQKQQADEAMTLLEAAMDETARRVKDLPVEDVADRDVGGNARQSLRAFSDKKRFVDVETDQAQFDGLSYREMGALATKVIKEKFAGKVIGIDNKAFVNGRSAGEYGFPLNKLEGNLHEAKMRASTELDNLLDAGTNFRTEPDGKDGHTHANAVGDFRYFDTIFKVGGEYYSGVINIVPVKKGLLLKDVTQIKNITKDISSSYGKTPKSTFLRDASMDSIPSPAQESNTKFSIPTARIQQIDPREIQPVNEVTDRAKADYLVSSFQDSGWNGRPVVVADLGNQYAALTGSHRIFAASEAGVPVDAVVLDYSDDIAPLLTANDDETRAKIAKELQEDGTIPDYIADLIVREDDLNWENYDVPYEEQARYSIKSYGEQERSAHVQAVTDHFGKTYRWKETGYLTPDGTRIDFSGRHNGGRGGYRTVDHRDVTEALGIDYGGDDYSGAMVQFMSEGNIRISPESGGINLSVQPTRMQEVALEDYISKERGEVILDIDAPGGDTIVSVEYPKGTRAGKVLADIRNYFENGTEPQVSELSKFRYSIKSPGVTGADAAALARENRELRKKLEHWKAQVKRTDRRDVDPKSLRQLARRLRADYNTEMGADEIAARLGEIYNGISHDMAYEEARERAQTLATDMIEQASVTEDYLYHEYEPMRKYFRETPLVLTPTDQKGITDYNDFRKAMFGKLRLKTGARSNVDQVYQELSMLWPEFFDEQRDITSLDQVERIAQVLDDIYRRDEVNPYAGDMAGPANFLASEIMDSFLDVPAVKKTFADRAYERQARKSNEQRQRAVQRERERGERSLAEAEMNARWREAELKATHEWLSAKDRHERQQKYDAAIKSVREQRDRKIRAEQEKRWEAVAAIRKQRDRKLSEQAAHHRETVQNMRQRQKERELRARIIRHSRDLSKKLLRPSDNRHVPQELRGAAAAVLESINLESVYTYDPVTGRRSKDPNGTPAKRTQAFQELRIAYQQIAEAEELDALALDPDLMANITRVESFRDTPIGALSLEQLDTVWRAIKAMENSITTANKMLAQSRFETVKDASMALKEDNGHKNKRTKYREAPGRFQKLLSVDMLTVQQYFHRMGKAGDEIFRMLRGAQDKQIVLLRDTAEDVHEITKGVNTRKLGREKKTFTFGEESVTFTKAQIMSLYALMKRPKAVEHILVGGMRPGDYSSGLKESERVDPIRLEREQIESITNSLTKEEKGVADRLQKILEKRMAAAGNEASMAVYGYEKFGDEHYFPIRTDKNQTVDDQAKGAQSATLAGRGFAQQTQPNASNAVIIDDIFDVVSDHVAEMSTYAAFLPAMEDLKRIFNFRFRKEEGGGDVKAIIETVHGKHGTDYWRKLTEDLNNGIKGINDGPFGGLVGAYKASAIGANLRVMIQQPTAILRALDEVNPADLIAAAGSVTPGAWERAKRYSPIAEWKSWGYFDAYTGRTVRDILFEDGDGLNRANNFLMSGAGAMDSLAWTHLWRALEIETKRTRKDLTPKTEEFYQAVAERFNRVIDRTQVVDGILQRSQIMRSPDGLTKMATSFMAEPTKVYNMLTGAAYDARNAATAAERKQAVGRLARTALALTTSVSVNAAMQSVVDALRDDDNDETYLEKFLQAFLGIGEDAKDEREERKNYIFSNLAEGFNPVNFVPFVRDLWSLVQGYSVDRMDMEAIERLVSEGQNMMKALEGGGKITTANATMRMIGELGRLVGVPAANIKRDSLAIVQTILRGTGSYKPLFEISKFLYRIDNPNNANTFLDIIYAARRAGDMEAYWDLSDELMTTLGKDEKWLEGKMTSRLAEDGNLAGIEAEQFRMFSQQVGNIKGDENGTKQENIISYIDGLDLSDEQKSALFRTQYDSDKNNPWA